MTGILQALLSFFGVSTASSANYIEDVFSTYLYTGTGATQTITNGIDLSGKGGLVWAKRRDDVTNHALLDSTRTVDKPLSSNLSNGNITWTNSFTAFNANGFSVGNDPNGVTNASGGTYASWTFREQPKFFDVVAYTGTGSNRTVSHNLGSVPGCIIVKRTDTTGDWQVYHRSLANTQYLVLNGTSAAATSATRWNSTTPTSTEFTVGTAAEVKASGATYVAYLFAHNAGGFGASGTDNVISCGSYTGNGSTTGPTVTLGYEPQWLLIKNSTAVDDWCLHDNIRGIYNTPGTNSTPQLYPNLASAENVNTRIALLPNGFQIIDSGGKINTSGSTYIYIAIRRGPMKVPTSATSVFGLNARTGSGVNTTVTGGAGVTDLALIKSRTSANAGFWVPRLTANRYLIPSATTAETTATNLILQTNPWDVMDGVKVGTTGNASNDTGNTYINYLFDRAPGFMDVVCYTGNGVSPQTITHNLGVTPEMFVYRERAGGQWWLYHSGLPSPAINQYVRLNTTDASANAGIPVFGVSSTTFTVTDTLGGTTNLQNYICYLFATLAGISKVGSYTGTGTTQVINCGFTAGSRFVMIKRTDSTGDWYYWDSARGIVAGNDPYLLMNSAAAEVTSTDYIDTANSGFEISSTAPAAINANGGTFIFLAIA